MFGKSFGLLNLFALTGLRSIPTKSSPYELWLNWLEGQFVSRSAIDWKREQRNEKGEMKRHSWNTTATFLWRFSRILQEPPPTTPSSSSSSSSLLLLFRWYRRRRTCSFFRCSLTKKFFRGRMKPFSLWLLSRIRKKPKRDRGPRACRCDLKRCPHRPSGGLVWTSKTTKMMMMILK